MLEHNTSLTTESSEWYACIYQTNYVDKFHYLFISATKIISSKPFLYNAQYNAKIALHKIILWPCKLRFLAIESSVCAVSFLYLVGH
jgi:hypothetical protein